MGKNRTKTVTNNTGSNKPALKAADVISALPQFELDGKKYQVLLPAARINTANGLVKMTAADICADSEAQKTLIDAGAIGSVIREITE